MSKWLVERLARESLLVLPGAYDALTAKLISASEAEVVYFGGFASTASSHGLPDVGLLGGAEMNGTYARMAAVVDKPVVVDLDTGYGGPLNVQRAVEAVASMGVAAFHIEDQQDPKRCGHLAGKRVLDVGSAKARVAAAVEAAGSDGPAVIARTDALAPEGMESVLLRAKAFEDVGADALFVDAFTDRAELERVRSSTRLPLVYNAAATGVSPRMTVPQLHDAGVDAVLYPIELLLDSLAAARMALDGLLDTGDPSPRATFDEVNELLGLEEYTSRDSRFAR